MTSHDRAIELARGGLEAHRGQNDFPCDCPGCQISRALLAYADAPVVMYLRNHGGPTRELRHTNNATVAKSWAEAGYTITELIARRQT